jgi:hypothetical protein
MINRLPLDVVMNHIIPYTYEPQPKKLLRDLKNNIEDYGLLENCYAFDYNYVILFRDLILFCNNGHYPSSETCQPYINIIRRHFMFQDKTEGQLMYYIFFKFLDNISLLINNDISLLNQPHERKIRFLWGLLKPKERTRFVNEYILKDEL